MRKRSRTDAPERLDIALALPLRENRVLVGRRRPGEHLEGLWEFPGGKVAAGEEPAAAARRELAEETGLVADRLEPLIVVLYDYPELPLRFHVFLCRDPLGEPRADPARPLTWKTYEELLELEMPPANRQMLNALGWRLGEIG